MSFAVTQTPMKEFQLRLVRKFSRVRIETVGNWKKNLDHKDYSVTEMGQNIEKCSGDLRRLVTQSPMKAY